MKFIFSYLKKYWLAVLAVVALTVFHVIAELSLPEYMSNIVTEGIQYGGIQETTPEILNESDLERLLVFVDEKDKNTVKNNYHLVEKGTSITLYNDEYNFDYPVYMIGKEDTSSLIEKPLLYMYVQDTQNIQNTTNNIEEYKKVLDTKIQEVSESSDNLLRLEVRTLYTNVGINTDNIQTNFILRMGVIMLGISIINVITILASAYLAIKTAARIAATMRKDIFTKIESFSATEFSRFSTSSLITRTNNDVTKVQQLVQMMMRMMLISPLMGIVSVVKVVRYPELSWILIVAIAFIILVMILLLVAAVPKFSVIQGLIDKINSHMREFLDGMLVIRAFNREELEEKKFDETNSTLTRIDRRISKLMAIAMPLMQFVMNSIAVAIIWFSAKQIDINVISVGDMMAFIQYSMHVVISFMMVSVTFFMVPRALVSVRRIKEVMDTDVSIYDKKDTKELPKENGDFEFDNVTFKYPGAEENVLENISFTAKPGETVAFIGSTGSGKSTIVKLIPRLFDVTEGSIKYCGIDIRDLKQHDLHDSIGYATQKAFLFKGTIESNIRFGRELSDDQVDEAIRVSQSENIIADKEAGVNSLITQAGTNVSGGQKQRLSIARALAEDKKIYVFDDSFSALDFETDKKLRAELDKVVKKNNSTVFIVAQRISTIMNADKIVVLDRGKVVGIGKHQDLLKNCDVYKEIASSQLSEKELGYAG